MIAITTNLQVEEMIKQGDAVIMNLPEFQLSVDFIKSKLSKKDYQELKDNYQLDLFPLEPTTLLL